jgi:hypothetical protein
MDERFTGIHRGGCVMSVFSIVSDKSITNLVDISRKVKGSV